MVYGILTRSLCLLCLLLCSFLCNTCSTSTLYKVQRISSHVDCRRYAVSVSITDYKTTESNKVELWLSHGYCLIIGFPSIYIPKWFTEQPPQSLQWSSVSWISQLPGLRGCSYFLPYLSLMMDIVRSFHRLSNNHRNTNLPVSRWINIWRS